MKIALFHNSGTGGAKRALYEHARHLRARGHALDSYVLSTGTEDYLPLGPVSDHLYRYEVPPSDTGVGSRLLRRVLTPRLAGRLGKYGSVFAGDYLNVHLANRLQDTLEQLYTRMGADIDARGYDLVYVHQCQLSLSPILLRRMKTPSVYYCQDTLRYVYEWPVVEHPAYDSRRDKVYVRKRLGRTHTLPELRLFARMERQYVASTRAATLVLANSWYSREAILRTTGVNAHLCYLGVDSDFFSPDPAVPKERKVLSVGALIPSKRHDFILEAIATIPRERRPQMEIIGYEMDPSRKTPNPVAEKLFCLAEEKKVELRILKEVTDDTLLNAYRSASVVAFAPYLEPFGFVPLEAMACGTPVVGVSEGGVRESIQDGVTGLLTERDTVQFGTAIDRLLTDKDLAREISANGRSTTVDRWTWERSTDNLERYMRTVS